MDYAEMLKAKTVTVEEAVKRIPSNSYIYTFGASGEPMTFFSNMSYLKGNAENVTMIDFLNTVPYDFYTDDSYLGVLRSDSCFFNRFCTAGQKAGRISYIPTHLRNSYVSREFYHEQRGGKPFVTFVLSATPMDKQGYFSTSTVAMSVRNYVKYADQVILEINENLPRTFGDTSVHISEVDCVFQGANKVAYLPSKPCSEEELTIGKYIADLIEDGSTIQLGIGGIPNAVALALTDKKDLGVHTEMLGDGIVELAKAGVINNSKKTLHENKMVTTFSFGSKETYDFLDDNPGVLHLSTEYVNNPYVICQNEKMVSVNTTLQVDLMGQCASESIGTLQISGIGGQTETASGAQMSKGGKSIIALRSTANIKDADGNPVRKSTIQPVHPEGTVISLLRCDTDFVVTEYGVAALRGASLSERARELINIAHPDYREELLAGARKYHLI